MAWRCRRSWGVCLTRTSPVLSSWSSCTRPSRIYSIKTQKYQFKYLFHVALSGLTLLQIWIYLVLHLMAQSHERLCRRILDDLAMTYSWRILSDVNAFLLLMKDHRSMFLTYTKHARNLPVVCQYVGWRAMSHVCSMTFLCGSTLVKVPLLQAGTVVIWHLMFKSDV